MGCRTLAAKRPRATRLWRPAARLAHRPTVALAGALVSLDAPVTRIKAALLHVEQGKPSYHARKPRSARVSDPADSRDRRSPNRSWPTVGSYPEIRRPAVELSAGSETRAEHCTDARPALPSPAWQTHLLPHFFFTSPRQLPIFSLVAGRAVPIINGVRSSPN
jgi:hypothetical protein